MKLKWTDGLSDKSYFSRADLMSAFEESGVRLSAACFKKKLQELLKKGSVARIGRNAYYIPQNGENIYDYQYSDLANEVAETIKETHPYLEFSVTELVQINEFVNHQIAHNVIFLATEEEVIDFAFDTLKEKYPGKVLLNPSTEMYHRYRYDSMIVLEKLVTEAPKGKKIPWHARIEKLLVDLLTEPLWTESISESEWKMIYEDAFSRYVIDESCLFRYAKRRAAEKRIKRFIADNTKIKLRIKR